MSKRFIKNIENFKCEKCGIEVIGDGFTNHCPICLWSKHVDVHPGDRAASCGGMMEPVEIICEKKDWKILHRCIICKYEKKNKTAVEDKVEKLINSK